MRASFAVRVVLLPLVALAAMAAPEFSANEGGKKDQQPPKVEIKLPEHKGKEIQHKLADLKKFEKPIPSHPKDHHPPEKKGGSWRWHQYHGWVWLTGVVPVEIVLPLTYSLPQQVVVYSVETVAISVICPHCGKPMFIQVK